MLYFFLFWLSLFFDEYPQAETIKENGHLLTNYSLTCLCNDRKFSSVIK